MIAGYRCRGSRLHRDAIRHVACAQTTHLQSGNLPQDTSNNLAGRLGVKTIISGDANGAIASSFVVAYFWRVLRTEQPRIELNKYFYFLDLLVFRSQRTTTDPIAIEEYIRVA